jgi:ribose transport system ATP-binding protein
LPELIGLCDRILVIYQGRLAGEIAGGDMDSHAILHLLNTGERSGHPPGPDAYEATVA